MRLAQHCNLVGLVGEHVKMTEPVGANATPEVPALYRTTADANSG
jgi:hypothetical protein